jgi:hypothetical protein
VTPGVDYLGDSSGKTYFAAADFGGAAPAGSVTISAGATKAAITVNLPASALGGEPDKWLGISITTNSGVPIYDPTAQVEVVSATPTEGSPAKPQLKLLNGGAATLSQSGTHYTLALGKVVEGVELPAFQFALSNIGDSGADCLKRNCRHGPASVSP